MSWLIPGSQLVPSLDLAPHAILLLTPSNCISFEWNCSLCLFSVKACYFNLTSNYWEILPYVELVVGFESIHGVIGVPGDARWAVINQLKLGGGVVCVCLCSLSMLDGSCQAIASLSLWLSRQRISAAFQGLVQRLSTSRSLSLSLQLKRWEVVCLGRD